MEAITIRSRLRGWKMGEERLLTVVQASDLHFGDAPLGSSQPSPPSLTISHLFKGWLDHHRQAVNDLHAAWIDLLDEREGERVIFALSGDLTANGAIDQFELAADFLGSKPSSNAFGMSLDLPNWAERAILGNHDHWPGTNAVLGPPALRANPHVPHSFPLVSEPIGLCENTSIRFILVDSDADVGFQSYDRRLGRGCFQSQLKTLRNKSVLPQSSAGELRVIIVHHAIADDDVPASTGPVPFPGWSVAAQWYHLKIDAHTLLDLQTFVVDAEIDVILTGHLHEPRLTEMRARSGHRQRRVFEARCGTTTQQDEGALLARSGKWPRMPSLPSNTLLLHELLRRDGRLIWASEVRQRSDADGFKAVPGFGVLRREFMI